MKKPRLPIMPCPHCDTNMIVRSSGQISPLVRELDYQCQNIACGHTCVSQLSIVRSIVASAVPRAGIHLPFGNPNLGPKRLPKPANDDTRPPANDVDLPAASAPDPMSG